MHTNPVLIICHKLFALNVFFQNTLLNNFKNFHSTYPVLCLYFYVVFFLFILFCFHFCCFLVIIGFGYLPLSLVMLNGFTELVKLNCILTLEIKSLDSEDVISIYRGFNFLWQSWDHMADLLTQSETGMILGSSFSIEAVWSVSEVRGLTTAYPRLLKGLIGLWRLIGSLTQFEFLFSFLEPCERSSKCLENTENVESSLWFSLASIPSNPAHLKSSKPNS